MKLKIIFSVFGIIALFLYPFIIYFGLHFFSIKWICLFLICLFAVRAVMISKQNNQTRFSRYLLTCTATLGMAFGLLDLFFNNLIFIKLYPVAMNLSFLTIFFASLFQEDNIIYGFAKRFSRQPLPSFVKDYTKKTTLVWCIFFALNSLFSLYTALFCSVEFWTFYNGFLSYILTGLLFIIEFIVRIFIKRKHQNA